MTEMVDIHCHVLPYVDDGAERMEEAEELLHMQYAQGVRTVCCTPHLRKGMFETPDEQIIEQFRRLRERVSDLQMQLYLSREYFCDEAFVRLVAAGSVLPLGKSKRLLVEFSHRYSERQIDALTDFILRRGYDILIAHAERYPALQESTDQIKRLIDMGAMIQMNAGSILGREGRIQARWSKKLLSERLVHVIASDAHDPEDRLPELDVCAAYLEKRIGVVYPRMMMHDNPLRIVQGL